MAGSPAVLENFTQPSHLFAPVPSFDKNRAQPSIFPVEILMRAIAPDPLPMSGVGGLPVAPELMRLKLNHPILDDHALPERSPVVSSY